MAKQYYQFTKKHFEFELKGILVRNRCGFMEDITEAYKAEGNETWERIYSISTKNKSVRILVFSSIDISTDKVRDLGGDAVKLVEEWTTKHGKVYKKLAHHYRLKTLFNNIEKTIIEAQSQVFGLNFKEFSKEV